MKYFAQTNGARLARIQNKRVCESAPSERFLTYSQILDKGKS
jgi:hypothetical protein